MALGNCGNYEVIKKVKPTKKKTCSQVLSIWKHSEQSCFIFSIYCFLASFFFRSQNSGNLKSGLLSLTKLKPKTINAHYIFNTLSIK